MASSNIPKEFILYRKNISVSFNSQGLASVSSYFPKNSYHLIHATMPTQAIIPFIDGDGNWYLLCDDRAAHSGTVTVTYMLI